jgi:hypothetical protein
MNIAFFKHANLLVMVAAIFLSSCARSIAFNSSSVVPAAEGKVAVKKDKNKNYAIQVKIKNLAEPGKLQPPKSTYVLWMESSESGIKNLGQLRTSSGMFGSALTASLQTVTSFEPRRFLITAEDDPKVEYPTNERVLETDEFAR